MLGPFATASRLTPTHQVSLPVLSRAACASMSTTPTTTTTTTTTRDRGDRYGPMEWAQLLAEYVNVGVAEPIVNRSNRTGVWWRRETDVVWMQWTHSDVWAVSCELVVHTSFWRSWRRWLRSRWRRADSACLSVDCTPTWTWYGARGNTALPCTSTHAPLSAPHLKTSYV